MKGPAAAIGWQLGARYRGYLIGFAAYLVVALLLIRLLPDNQVCRFIRFYVAFPLAVSPLGLIAVFVFGADAEFASRESNYPHRMLSLPVSSHALTGWPMLYGVTVTCIFCTALTSLALRPSGIMVPHVWPPVFVAVLLAWIQVVGWSTNPLPFLRPILLAIVTAAQVLVVWIAYSLAGSGELSAVLLALQLPLCWYLATRGVRLARRGKGVDASGTIFQRRANSTGKPQRREPFRDRVHAQRWLEWRIHGWCFPFVVGICLLFLAALILFKRQDPGLSGEHWLRSPYTLFALPVLLALNIGTISGRFIAHLKDQEPSSFLATKPMSNVDLVAIKLRSVLISVFAAYAITGTSVILLLTITFSWYEKWPTLAAIEPRIQGPILISLAVALLMFLAWKLGAEFLFVGLAGRPWVIVLFGAATTMGTMSIVLASLALYAFPSLQATVIAALPTIVWILVAFKFAVSAWLWCKLLQRQMLSRPVIIRFIVCWGLTVCILSAILIAALPGVLVPIHLLIASVVLTVPTSRLLVAPLALSWNRHR